MQDGFTQNIVSVTPTDIPEDVSFSWSATHL